MGRRRSRPRGDRWSAEFVPLAHGSRPTALLVEDLDGDGTCARESLFRRGDANSDGSVNIGDATIILAHLFSGGGELRCPDAADTNDSGQVEITDSVALLEYLFQSGAEPAPPGPMTCGADPSGDDLRTWGASCF